MHRTFHNPRAGSQLALPGPDPRIGTFHKTLPQYSPTPLVSLPEIAKELGISHLFLKNESSRFGLPAFKILGASWATAQAITKRLKLERPNLPLEQLAKAAQDANLTLYAATDGSHGRAVSRMAKYLGIKARIIVPNFVDSQVISNIRSEGSTVEINDGDYDQTVLATKRAAEEDSQGLLISDTALEVGDEMAGWIVDGYQTMFEEIDEQLGDGESITHVIVPVGVGSLAQAVVTFYGRKKPRPKIVTVEPEAAACLKASLEADKSTTVGTGYTILTGMCCGTLSANGWPLLRESVDIATTVDDGQVVEAMQELRRYSVHAGPLVDETSSCLLNSAFKGSADLVKGGAASLAAARQLCETRLLDSSHRVLVLCTEGSRHYRLKP